MADEAIELVRMRNDFYRDNYRRLALAFFLSLIIITILVGMMFYVMSRKPEPKYFATTDDGRILPLVSLNQAYRTDAEVQQFAAEAAVAAYSYDFANYRKQLQEASAYFTADGWAQYMKALQDSGNLEAIKSGNIIAIARPTGAPQIQTEGLLNNRYAWSVQIPLAVTFQGQQLSQTENYTITLTIVRVSTLDKPSGIGVQQVISEQSNGGATSTTTTTPSAGGTQ